MPGALWLHLSQHLSAEFHHLLLVNGLLNAHLTRQQVNTRYLLRVPLHGVLQALPASVWQACLLAVLMPLCSDR